MKKIYRNIDLEIIYFLEEDIVTASYNEDDDNLEPMPDFPEGMG